ncbi:uncharacterized protein LTR77_002653 [Saxophila tyrrhenica]|uniref:Uncharacterized protein n=1 Tax=Saxophila tyrrhenica TaxID=1690608 RepID=A0AAV9PJE6_9PEZI|nr:hypothetical protein LTR77_002653 [Saxophila tyrrhenica]
MAFRSQAERCSRKAESSSIPVITITPASPTFGTLSEVQARHREPHCHHFEPVEGPTERLLVPFDDGKNPNSLSTQGRRVRDASPDAGIVAKLKRACSSPYNNQGRKGIRCGLNKSITGIIPWTGHKRSSDVVVDDVAEPFDPNFEGTGWWPQPGHLYGAYNIRLNIRQFDKGSSARSRCPILSGLLNSRVDQNIEVDLAESYEEVYRKLVRKALRIAITDDLLMPGDIAGDIFHVVDGKRHLITPANWESEKREWCAVPGILMRFDFFILPKHTRVLKGMGRKTAAWSRMSSRSICAAARKMGRTVGKWCKGFDMCGMAGLDEMDEQERMALRELSWPYMGEFGR